MMPEPTLPQRRMVAIDGQQESSHQSAYSEQFKTYLRAAIVLTGPSGRPSRARLGDRYRGV